MNARQATGLIGCILLFLGVFAPAVREPLAGSTNYLANGKIEGTVVIILAAVSLVLVLVRLLRWLWLTGLVSFGALACTFIALQRRLGRLKSDIDSRLGDTPLKGFADEAMKSFQMQWGWAPLIAGAVLLIAASLMDRSVDRTQ